MARIIYSALVSSIRGSIAGTTFQKNRYGYSTRNKPISANQRTDYQLNQRSAFLSAVRAWSQLSAAEISAWNNSAALNPVPSKNNPAVNIDTYNYFVLKNTYQILAGLPLQTSPSVSTYNVGTLVLVLNVTAGIFNISTSVSARSGNWHILFFLSPPLVSSINYARNRTRYITSHVYGTYFIPGVGQYNSRFGISAQAGDLIYSRVAILNDNSCQLSVFDVGLKTVT